MKEFLINNAIGISYILGICLLLGMIKLLKLLDSTKYEFIPHWYFIGLVLIGVITSSETIAKWFLK